MAHNMSARGQGRAGRAMYRRRFRLRGRWVALALLILVTPSLLSCFSYGLAVESVNKYTPRYGMGSDLPNSIANGDGFIQGMTKPGSPWKLDQRWTDNDVYDTDFIDPDRGGAGGDGLYFDKPGLAISYFSGHGNCSGCSQGTPCTSTAQCTNPAPGSNESLPSSCRFAPGVSGTCCYNSPRYLFTNSDQDKYNGSVIYGNGFIKWGENSAAGAWAGAGTNGGTHMVVMDLSCGVLSTFWWNQLQPAIGGLHLLATIMPINGDTANVSDRGATFAQRWAANPEGAPAVAWLDTLNSLAQNDGGPCAGTDYRNGGGHGINGCGCNFVIAFDTDAAGASSKINENWSNLRDDDRAAKGANWYSARWMCNYTLSRTDKFAFERP
ncbi:MAG: DUF6345 domain-containing protein [Pyrinomonadaceae bacterium]